MSMPTSCFSSLPDEILSNIVLQLPMVDILRCRMVSGTVTSIVDVLKSSLQTGVKGSQPAHQEFYRYTVRH